jgi:NADH-quinone oxidoreductase subunit M
MQPKLVSTGLSVLALWSCVVALAFAMSLYPARELLATRYGVSWPIALIALASIVPEQILQYCLDTLRLHFTPWIYALAVIGIIYGAWVSTVQPDIKKLVAYSSVSHLGFVVLGLFTLTPQGLVGGIIQMVNHGLSTGALFLVVGMLYERRHTRLIADYGGLWKVVPALSVVFLIVSLSSLGLPGLNGFVGEFLILVGTFQVNRTLAVFATTGIIFAAVYLLWMYQRVFFGVVTKEANRHLPDLSGREWAVLLPILLFIVWIGVYPAPFTGMTEASAQALIAQVQSKAAATASARIIP